MNLIEKIFAVLMVLFEIVVPIVIGLSFICLIFAGVVSLFT